MKKILLSLITFFGAIFVGRCVNMVIITFGGQLIPPPAGINPTDMNSIAESMNLHGLSIFYIHF